MPNARSLRIAFSCILPGSLGAAVPALHAQSAPARIECIVPAGQGVGDACRYTVAKADTLQEREIRVRVTDASGRPVRTRVYFRASAGTVFPDSVSTDLDGVASTRWTRAGSKDEATVVVAAANANGTATRLVTLAPPSQQTRKLRVVAFDGNNQRSFEKTQLRSRLVVEIQTDSGKVLDPKTCRDQRVAFARVGGVGTVMPDTAYADLSTKKDSAGSERVRCIARSAWTLSEGVGDRRVRAYLVPGEEVKPDGRPAEFAVLARAMPRLIGGVAVGYARPYFKLKEGSKTTLRVERPLPDGGKFAFDSIVTSAASIDSITRRTAFNTVVGVSAPLPLRHLDRATIMLGVDVQNPSTDWYGGISLLRLGKAPESGFYDLIGFLHWGRIDEIEDRDACINSRECTTRKPARFRGGGVMLTLDAGSLLTEVIKKIGT